MMKLPRGAGFEERHMLALRKNKNRKAVLTLKQVGFKLVPRSFPCERCLR